jgi:DNA-binding transcriptional LysR family regulator
MNLNGLTLDQCLVFTTVAAEGSFSATARRMNRAQSAVTYASQKLEAQLGLLLFDRSGYRPVLTEAGAALLPRA